MVAEVATRALKAVWYQKWFVHRRLRPEVYAGRIHFHKKGKAHYPFDADEFKKLDPVAQGGRGPQQEEGRRRPVPADGVHRGQSRRTRPTGRGMRPSPGRA